jgi:hypothetical protein
MASRVMMRLDALKELVWAARCADAVARPFPSGVAASDDRRGFLNASESGYCTRWLWYAKHGVTGEDNLPWGVFDRGHGFELWFTTYLAAALANGSGRLLYTGARQKRLLLPAFRLAGTPDGLIVWKDGSESVLEVKSHGAAYNYDSSPNAMHIKQCEANIELFHETTQHRPEEAIIVYGLAEDYGRLALHRVERRPAVFMELLGKAMAAFDAKCAKDVTAEGALTKQCVICPYRTRCDAAAALAIPAAGTGGLDEPTLHNIDRLVAARQRALEAGEEATRACAEAEAEITAVLTEAGAHKVKRNGYAVTLTKTSAGDPAIEIRSA